MQLYKPCFLRELAKKVAVLTEKNKTRDLGKLFSNNFAITVTALSFTYIILISVGRFVIRTIMWVYFPSSRISR